jgi:hypothetical protein
MAKFLELEVVKVETHGKLAAFSRCIERRGVLVENDISA